MIVRRYHGRQPTRPAQTQPADAHEVRRTVKRNHRGPHLELDDACRLLGVTPDQSVEEIEVVCRPKLLAADPENGGSHYQLFQLEDAHATVISESRRRQLHPDLSGDVETDSERPGTGLSDESNDKERNPVTRAWVFLVALWVVDAIVLLATSQLVPLAIFAAVAVVTVLYACRLFMWATVVFWLWFVLALSFLLLGLLPHALTWSGIAAILFFGSHLAITVTCAQVIRNSVPKRVSVPGDQRSS